MPRLPVWILSVIIGGAGLIAARLPAQTRAGTPAPAPIELEQITVEATGEEHDVTGMGTVEDELVDVPFANELTAAIELGLDADSGDLPGELEAIAGGSPADRIAGSDRLRLRGFPTPALRNGFIQIGIPEVLNSARTIVIQGPLVPVLGRAAPGGIQNFMTARPRGREQLRLVTTASNRHRQRASLEYTSPVRERKTWQRVALEWDRRGGPEAFARQESIAANAALVWRHSRLASTLFALDYREVGGRVAPGIPEYRLDATQPILGPWLPLALFNANGPEAEVHRRSATASIQLDSQPNRRLSFRASLEGWWSDVIQERFTTSVLDLAAGRFAGRREPRHLELPQEAAALRLEGTWRFAGLQAEHKLLAAASAAHGTSHREEYALTPAAREALPPDVLSFDPLAPNYFLPAFDPIIYGRTVANREEQVRYLSIEVGDRAAWALGRMVATTGLRLDAVEKEVTDLKPGVTLPWAQDRTQQFSHHVGLNWQLQPGRLLLFANRSTAFDPTTPVDARTGRIQDNETTHGHEAGLRGRALGGRLDYLASGFLLLNRHIARRNPLYNDPIADADQTQPQLVAAGAEEFRGGRLQLRWAATKALQFSLNGVVNRAVTTASPDLPQEVGRPLTRLPPVQIAANLRHQPGFAGGRFSWNAGWTYLGRYMATYPDPQRAELGYPGYGLVSVGAGWEIRRRGQRFGLEAAVRNAFDRDLARSHARIGAGREVMFSVRLNR